MSGRTRPRIPVALAMAAAFAASAPAAPAAAGDLDAYRDLARSPRGAGVLAFARAALESALDGAAAPDTGGAAVPDWPAEPAGIYLSLVGAGGTRACVGSTTPPAGTLAASLGRVAADLVAADRRRPPLRRSELGSLALVVTFAGEAEPVADPMQVRLAREGLLIRTPQGTVAYVPGEARTVSWALADARRHGLLARRADASFYRFAAVTLREPPAPSREASDAPR